MAVKVTRQETGDTRVGKFATLTPTEVSLFSGIMSDKKGGWRGCGKKWVFPRQGIQIIADEPDKELKGN